MNNIREHIYLAALLHDIGKFYQRADKPLAQKENELSESIVRIADYICPLKDGSFGYQHTLWTLQFLVEIEPYLKKIPEFMPNAFETDKTQDSIFQLASFHHKPATELQALISLADWWSAGIDRREKLEAEEGENAGISWGKSRYKQIPLYSIFNNIEVPNKGKYKGSSAFGLKALSIDEKDFFPKNIKKKDDGVSQEKYAKLWAEFKKEIQWLPTDTFEGFTESLLMLLKKYTWCIPSNTTDMANVSLFDHLKTTAAFADCLYRYKKDNPNDFNFNNQRLSLKEGVKPVMLLGGDLSGIQKFIYNIASRKAATSLKGRSFYLQLLVDSIIQRIIQHKDIDATLGHVVYSSGGKFYMLLPNIESVTNAVAELKKEIEKELWEQHNGQLLVNIDYVPFAYNIKGKGVDFDNCKDVQIGELWKALADRLTNQKNHKFRNLLIDEYDEFFEVQKVGGKTNICAVTGIEGKCVAIDPQEEGEKTLVLPIVKEQAQLGNTLKDADYIVTYKSNDTNKYISNRVKIDIHTTGIHNYLFNKLELTDNDADFRRITSADTCRVKVINRTNFLGVPLKGNGCSYGFQFYGGNKQAVNEQFDRNKTFEELADGTYLGILRMDVDNLGSIFIKGIPDADKSFSSYSTLSFMLDYFFSGYLNTIRGRENFKDNVNILYSGGDDVFAVGRWDKLIEFAAEIREEFRKFTGRDDISISGGIAMVGDKYPIAKAAEMAGKAEEDAKKDNGGKKDAFNMFGETISWCEEYNKVLSRKNEFVSLMNDFNMPRSILHRLMILCQNMKNGRTDYIWHTVYYLKRFSDGKDKTVQEFCNSLKTILTNRRDYELTALAARWAELELRMNNVKQKQNN